MEPKNAALEKSYELKELASNLNELRDALVMLSTKIKDYKATVDWDAQGDAKVKSKHVLDRAAKGPEG